MILRRVWLEACARLEGLARGAGYGSGSSLGVD
jgi:hypothetical protein